MKIKCVAIDDEPLALGLIEKMVQKFPSLTLVATFDDPISGAEFLRGHAMDLLFIDINMPDVNGLALVRSLHEKPMIIFTTAHRSFAIESYELDAIDYLVKPIRQERFDKAVNKAIEYYRYKQAKTGVDEEALFVRAEYRLMKINLPDIEYIESMEDYCKIHLLNAKPVMTLMTLKNILEKLPPSKFKRIHRSYIVSLTKVRSVVNRKIRLISTEIPISASYISSVTEWIKK
jgi:two-component system, LytTR family, response regulator